MQVCKIRCPRLDACRDPIERESPVIEQDDRAFIVGGFGDDAQRFPGSDILCALPKNGQGIVSHLRKKLILLPLIKNEVFL